MEYKFSFLLLFFLVLIILSGCGVLTKGMDKQEILSDLKEKYNEDFEFVGEVGKESQGFMIYEVIPKNSPELKFHAHLTESAGGVFTYKSTMDDYATVQFIYHSPEIYKKHLGKNIDREEIMNSYYDYVKKNEILIFETNFFETSPLVIKDINPNNMKQHSVQIADALEAYSKVPFFARYTEVDYNNRSDFNAGIPFLFTGQNEMSSVGNQVMISHLHNYTEKGTPEDIVNWSLSLSWERLMKE